MGDLHVYLSPHNLDPAPTCSTYTIIIVWCGEELPPTMLCFLPVPSLIQCQNCIFGIFETNCTRSVPRPPWIGLVPAHPTDACKIGIWGIRSTPQALCHVPLVIPDQILWCGSAHSPPGGWGGGGASVTVDLTSWHCRGSFVVFVWMFFRNKSDSHSGLKIRQVCLLRAVFTHHFCMWQNNNDAWMFFHIPSLFVENVMSLHLDLDPCPWGEFFQEKCSYSIQVKWLQFISIHKRIHSSFLFGFTLFFIVDSCRLLSWACHMCSILNRIYKSPI